METLELDTEKFKQQRRVKLYMRESSGTWADLGTGYVTMATFATLEVRSETDSLFMACQRLMR